MMDADVSPALHEGPHVSGESQGGVQARRIGRVVWHLSERDMKQAVCRGSGEDAQGIPKDI